MEANAINPDAQGPYCLIDFILYLPVNKFSAMSGQVFLGSISIKHRLMCLPQGHDAVLLVRLEPATSRSRVKRSTTQSRVKHSNTEPLCSLRRSILFAI